MHQFFIDIKTMTRLAGLRQSHAYCTFLLLTLCLCCAVLCCHPSANYTGEAPLALPKLNLQFLSPSDYLLRNFHLFRLEAAYEVREDIQVSEGGGE